MKESQAARILQLLKSKGTVTNIELNRIAFRYGARIHELRKEGHTIVSNRVSESVFTFTYHGERTPEKRHPVKQIRTTKTKGQLSLL